MSDNEYYVVRGACMRCTCGTHPRKINLPNSHGAFVNGKPMMNEGDYSPENVPHFGICNSPEQPSAETIYLIAEDGSTISGKPCLPMLTDKWKNTKEPTKVEGQPALTTSSFQTCLYHGFIEFHTNGQQEE
ncbi:DUF4280 domain-containing protein [Paenibacillus sp. EKM212P]|uniref:DUF4280 domain-containing protein n=1 Tax=unclassified Paenibacillus TaxID=185978 RepID=UPI0013EBEBB0|nr:DUF4280 domain-containing protein [Paenibacillus sp. EKM212P]KAF6578557.1 DUF4280 domain-containing protein [Paenibacillus sp. EKM212P]